MTIKESPSLRQPCRYCSVLLLMLKTSFTGSREHNISVCLVAFCRKKKKLNIEEWLEVVITFHYVAEPEHMKRCVLINNNYC